MPSFDARVIQQPGCTKRRLVENEAEGESAAKRLFLERETFEPITSSGVRRRKYPTISLANNVEAVKKIQAILDLVAMSLLAIPFMEVKKERSERERPESISEVKKKLEGCCYKKTDEVLLDLENIFSAENKEDQEMNLFIGAEECQRKFVISAEEREQWGKKLRRDLSTWVETTFVDEAAFQQPVHSKILSALTRRFPHVSQDQLKVRSCQVAESKDTEKWKSVLQKVNEVNANNTPGVAYKKYRFFPSSKQHEFDDEEHLVHKSIAGYQFHKMISKWSDPASSIPVPLRTVSNPSDAIAHIDYIKNSKLEKIYEDQKERFLQENKDVKEVLLFHGTSASCVESILKTNFQIDHLPVQQTNQNDVRDKKMMFGRGVYFSEIPAVSLMYGNGLILCKVLLGNCQEYRPVASGEQPDIPEGFDSRQVITKDGSSVIHVARNTSQILPYCVIQLKNDAISSDYRKPCPTLPAVHFTMPTTAKVIKADPPSQVCREDQIEKTLKAHTTPINPKITMKISLCQSSGGAKASTPELSSCPVCLESLLTGVVALPCLHKMHETCAKEAIDLGQAGPGCLQCPECQAVHGVRTGNQPLTGDMTWTTITTSLPGHPGQGTIVIRYRMEGGVQGKEHPRPGRAFQAPGFPRMAYLPDSDQGRTVLSLLSKAFRRRLIFTVGASLTSGQEDCVTWAGIHHKTKMTEDEHGFPDLGYLHRVMEELKERGVVVEDAAVEDISVVNRIKIESNYEDNKGHNWNPKIKTEQVGQRCKPSRALTIQPERRGTDRKKEGSHHILVCQS